MPHYAVALYIPYVLRIEGVEAGSPAQAVDRATAFARTSQALRSIHDGALDLTATEPRVAYFEPHEPGDPIGAQVDAVNPEEGEYVGDGEYRELQVIDLYRSATRWPDESGGVETPARDGELSGTAVVRT
jgi:hypothetical protein